MRAKSGLEALPCSAFRSRNLGKPSAGRKIPLSTRSGVTQRFARVTAELKVGNFFRRMGHSRTSADLEHSRVERRASIAKRTFATFRDDASLRYPVDRAALERAEPPFHSNGSVTASGRRASLVRSP